MKLAWMLLIVPMVAAQAQQLAPGSPEAPLEVGSLSGFVDDVNGHPLPQAHADLLDCATNQVTKRSLVDTDGGFTLTAGWESPDYCLRFSLDGFDTVQMRVKLKKSAGKIRVTLTTA